jgi:proteasome lid subunit RPN8/RPN11
MVTHAVSGGKNEVMGVMQGKVVGDTFIIMDAFGLPVQGVETSVSAGDQAMQYMLDKNELSHDVRFIYQFLDGKTRKCMRLVSQPSGLFLLLLRY